MPRQTSEEQPNHRRRDQRFAGLHFSFVIFTHSPVVRNPTERALHRPTARHNAKTAGAWSALHHFQFPLACNLTPDRQLLLAIGCVCPDLFFSGHLKRMTSFLVPSSHSFPLKIFTIWYVFSKGRATRLKHNVNRKRLLKRPSQHLIWLNTTA